MVKCNKLILYYLCHFFYGAGYYTMGPYIPFLAAQSGQPEITFFPLIIGKGLGFIFGPLFNLFVLKNVKQLHRMLFIQLMILAISVYILTITFNVIILSIASFVLCFAIALLDISINISIITYTNNKVGRAIIISHNAMIFGSCFNALLMSFLGSSALVFIAIFNLLYSLVFLLIKPMKMLEEKPEQSSNIANDKIQSTQQIDNIEDLEKTQQNMEKNPKKLPKKIFLLLCLTLFIYTSQEHCFKTWYPTFVVQMNYMSKQRAAFVIGIMTFLIMHTAIFKFKNESYLKASSYANIVLFWGCVLAYYIDFTVFLTYISPLIFSAFNSVLYSFYYSLPSDYNYKLSAKEGSWFIFAYSLGQVILVTIGGYMMILIHPISLFFLTGVIANHQPHLNQINHSEIKTMICIRSWR